MHLTTLSELGRTQREDIVEKVEKRFVQGPLGWWWGSLAELTAIVNRAFAAFEPRTAREVWRAYIALSKDMGLDADPFLAYWNGKVGSPMIQGCDPWCGCVKCAAEPQNVGGDDSLVPGGWFNDVLRWARKGVWSVGLKGYYATQTADEMFRIGRYVDGRTEQLDIPGQYIP